MGYATRAATSQRDGYVARAAHRHHDDTAPNNTTTTAKGRSPAGSEPTGPDSEHQGRTSASEDNRRSESAGEGSVSDPLFKRLAQLG